MKTGIFITDINGMIQEVTDLNGALEQAKTFVGWHDRAKKDAPTDQKVLYFEDAHKYWVHILKELEKIEIKVNTFKVNINEKIENQYPEETKNAREYWLGNGFVANTKHYIKNGSATPLYTYQANALFMSARHRRRLDNLEIGETTVNEGGSIITRIF